MLIPVKEKIHRKPREQTWDQVWALTQNDAQHLTKNCAQKEIHDLIWDQINDKIANTIFNSLIRL